MAERRRNKMLVLNAPSEQRRANDPPPLIAGQLPLPQRAFDANLHKISVHKSLKNIIFTNRLRIKIIPYRMNNLSINNVPKLKIAQDIRKSRVFEPNAVYNFYYETEIHKEIPHVVKFSGGRSSAMMLFTLLEAGILNAERGDVIVFNNTSAEHPKTYEFTQKCKEFIDSYIAIF